MFLFLFPFACFSLVLFPCLCQNHTFLIVNHLKHFLKVAELSNRLLNIIVAVMPPRSICPIKGHYVSWFPPFPPPPEGPHLGETLTMSGNFSMWVGKVASDSLSWVSGSETLRFPEAVTAPLRSNLDSLSWTRDHYFWKGALVSLLRSQFVTVIFNL